MVVCEHILVEWNAVIIIIVVVVVITVIEIEWNCGTDSTVEYCPPLAVSVVYLPPDEIFIFASPAAAAAPRG